METQFGENPSNQSAVVHSGDVKGSGRFEGIQQALDNHLWLKRGLGIVGLAITLLGAVWGFGRLGGLNGPSNNGNLAFAAIPGMGRNIGGTNYNAEYFEKVGAALDNPQRIYSEAGYSQLWTAQQGKVASSLPTGLKTVPHEARLWEPWFRKHLTNNGKQLSTGEIMAMKWAIAKTVANDPACKFVPGQPDAEIFRNLEAARIKALHSLGIDNPSSALFQMSRLDTAWARSKSQRNYSRYSENKYLGNIEDGQKRYPTLSELNHADFGLNCGRSALEMIYFVRGMEKIKPSGVKIGSCYVFLFSESGEMGLHGVNGGIIILPDGQKGHAYYDPTAAKGAFNQAGLELVSRTGGPVDEASVERLATWMCVAVIKDSLDENEKKISVVSYTYILGENWPQLGLGNFDRAACPDYGIYGGGSDYDSRVPGMAAFKRYHADNLGAIRSLHKTVDRFARGEF